MIDATFTVRALGALSAGALALGALSGCAPTPEPSPTKTALFASDEEAFVAAEETYRAYTEALNNVDTNDPATFEPMFEYATGDFLAADKKTFSELHARHLVTQGEMKVVNFVGVKSRPPFEEIESMICVDVSETDVVDADGISQVSADRPSLNALNVTFKVTGSQLRIAHASRNEGEACVLN